ncbi:MAG: hypothetical protein ABI456_04530 [Ktedonobacteraceae bacterium]|nr:hypothetical protein [Chloroflexota bacterium]
MNDPRFLVIFSVVIGLLGVYNLYQGRKRMAAVRANGLNTAWYKQVSILTGIEYILLALVFLLSSSIRTGVLPKSLNNIVFPLYLLILLSAAVIAGLVIRQAFKNSRQLRASAASRAGTLERVNGASTNMGSADDLTDEEGLTEQQRREGAQRRRERRQKAAAARRRKAGKA